MSARRRCDYHHRFQFFSSRWPVSHLRTMSPILVHVMYARSPARTVTLVNWCLWVQLTHYREVTAEFRRHLLLPPPALATTCSCRLRDFFLFAFDLSSASSTARGYARSSSFSSIPWRWVIAPQPRSCALHRHPPQARLLNPCGWSRCCRSPQTNKHNTNSNKAYMQPTSCMYYFICCSAFKGCGQHS